MTNKLDSHFRDLADRLERLSKVFFSGPEGSKYKGFFEEFLAANEFELALHVVRDYLLEPFTPGVDEATVGQIETLHKLMGLQDGCAASVKGKSERATEH
jgi:hypothetical protein